MNKNKDVFLGAGIIVLAAVFLSQLREVGGDSAMFPRALLYVILFCGAAIIVRSLWMQKKQQTDGAVTFSLRSFARDALIPGGLLLALTWLLTVLGFYIGTFVVFLAVCVLEEIVITKTFRPGGRRLAVMVLSAAASSVFMYVCFKVLLKLPTPNGPFGF